jgi:uncharacterized SAM-binding protein YcdF (DUF218 family)
MVLFSVKQLQAKGLLRTSASKRALLVAVVVMAGLFHYPYRRAAAKTILASPRPAAKAC